MRTRILAAALTAVGLAAAAAPMSAHAAGRSAVADPPTISAGVNLKTGVLEIREADPDNGFHSLVVKVKRDQGRVYIKGDSKVAAGPLCISGSFVEHTASGRPEDKWMPQAVTYNTVCSASRLTRVDIDLGRTWQQEIQVLLSHVPVTVVGSDFPDYIEYVGHGSDGSLPPYFSTARIDGGKDEDQIVGGAGNDDLRGGGGPDEITGNCGSDVMRGGPGIDSLLSDEGEYGGKCAPAADRVNCGPGRDEVVADRLDRVQACEKSN